MRYHLLVLSAVLLLISGCAAEPEAPVVEPEPEVGAPAPGLPDMIVAERGGFIPEGVEYDTASGRLLTGSLSEGSIYQIQADGRVEAVVTDTDLVSSVGIEVDEPGNRLLVANSDRDVFGGEATGQAKLGVYDLATGEHIAMVDLAAAIADAPDDAAYFANDVAVGDDGTAYVTDTQMNVIYEVSSPDYTASVLYAFAPGEGPGLNGIVYHASGYLLVAGGESLFKVPLDDPAGISLVTLPETVGGQDGVVWAADGRLAIASNSESRVVALTSNDDWVTAELAGVATYEVQATTAAAVGDDIFVVHPHFNDEDPPSFERVTFE